MLRILLPCCAALAALTLFLQEDAMRSPDPASGSTAQRLSDAGPEEQARAAPIVGGRGGGDRRQAALGPVPSPVSAAENPAPAAPTDSREEARGRRTVSTAFVMVGPDGHLTVELRDRRVLVLRDVVMRPRDYCGDQVLGGKAGARYCGTYAEVAAARPGGAPAAEKPVRSGSHFR